MNHKPSQLKGFSLLEILIAFTIFSISITLLLNIFSSGLNKIIVSDEYQQAVLIAESKLALTGMEIELEPGTKQGSIDDKYYWHIQINEFETKELPIGTNPGNMIPYQVNVTVSWSAGQTNRVFELSSIKLATVP